MSNKKMWVMMVGALITSFISATTLTAPMLVGKLALGNETLMGELGRITLVTPGQIVVMGEGTLPLDYTIEVKAKAKNHTLLTEEQVHLTLSSSSPVIAGSAWPTELWYVQDNNGAMTEKDAALAVIKVQYNP